MAFLLYDNFLWNEDITITPSSEKNTAPFSNILNPDPYVFWETTDCIDESIILNLSGTGNKKPFVIGFYNVNWTADAILSIECDSAGTFSPAFASDSHIIQTSIYDYSNNPKGYNKGILVGSDILAAGDSDKAYIKIRIQDPDNPDGFLRTGILYLASAISFNVRDVKTVDEGVSQKLINRATKFYSYNSQLHTRARKIEHILKCSISDGGLYSKIAIRRIIKAVGKTKPVFLSLNEYGEGLSDYFGFSTQVYYGTFSDLPNIKENFYYEPMLADGNFENYGGINYDFEFTEIV